MFDSKYATHQRAPFFELVRTFIKPTSRVLDIGPGMGAFSKHFGRTDFYLFEGNPHTVAKLREEHRNVSEGYLPNLPFEDGFFDVIHCSHVVEHLQPQDFYDTLREVDRCLKPGGVMVFSAPLMWTNFYNDLSHIRPYNPNTYRKYLCPTAIDTLTRGQISDKYVQVLLQFRYKETPPPIYFNSKNNPLVWGFLKGLSLMRKMGLKHYEKTGYTIALEKGM